MPCFRKRFGILKVRSSDQVETTSNTNSKSIKFFILLYIRKSVCPAAALISPTRRDASKGTLTRSSIFRNCEGDTPGRKLTNKLTNAHSNTHKSANTLTDAHSSGHERTFTRIYLFGTATERRRERLPAISTPVLAQSAAAPLF